MNIEERVAVLETTVEYMSILLIALLGREESRGKDLLRVAISHARDLHAANAPYQGRLSEDQIQKVEAMLAVHLRQ